MTVNGFGINRQDNQQKGKEIHDAKQQVTEIADVGTVFFLRNVKQCFARQQRINGDGKITGNLLE